MIPHWQHLLLKPTTSIKDALEIIDRQASRIVLVVDKNRKLLGTVTDGDIRRGLLKSVTIDACIEQIMNRNPLTTSPNIPANIMKETMLKNGILSLPIVENGIVIGLDQLNTKKIQKNYNNPVFIMAGGYGTRLKPLTDHCPKPLLKIGNKPILDFILQNFIKYGFKNFYISTHYMPEKIRHYFGDGEHWGVKITYVHEKEPLGTGGALGLLPDNIDKAPLIMINGDILTTTNFEKLLKFHINSNADVTMCVRDYEYQIPYGVIYEKGNKVVRLEEKPIKHFYVNAGIYVLNYELVRRVKKNSKIDMPNFLENIIAENGNILMHPIHEYWLDIGRMDDFKRAQADIASLESKW